MSITVLYMPGFEKSPLPNGDKEHTFLTHDAFKEWVATYVCGACLLDFENEYGQQAETLKDWLDGGCGCEIHITDPDNLIYWNDRM